MDRLVAASDLSCIAFKKNLYSAQANANFYLGSLATGATGAGAIVTQASPARILSGIGAILIGVRGEANEDYYRRIYVEAIGKAIENKRQILREQMDQKHSKEFSEYTVEAAVADALRYNNACSLVEGVAEVSHSVDIADDPVGLRALQSQLGRAGYQANVKLEKLDTIFGGSDIISKDAQAVTATSDINGWIAHLQIVEKASEGRLEAGQLADKADRKVKVKKLLDDLVTAGALKTDGLVGEYQSQLASLKTNYNNLVTKLTTATTEDEQSQISALMRANDRDAATVLAAIRTLFTRAERDMIAVEKAI